MTSWTLLAVAMYTFLICFYGRSLYVAVMKRMSPKYALKYEQNQERKRQRIRQRYVDKWQQREAKRRARLAKWVEENPNDPVAKSYLALSLPVSSSEDIDVSEFDPVAELRREQSEADEYAQRRRNRELTAELRAQQLFDWAIANPHTPEARRHLNEKLEEAAARLRYAESDVKYQRAMVTYRQDEGGPESILYASNLVEAEAKVRTEEQLIRQLQEALSVPLPANEEQ